MVDIITIIGFLVGVIGLLFAVVTWIIAIINSKKQQLEADKKHVELVSLIKQLMAEKSAIIGILLAVIGIGFPQIYFKPNDMVYTNDKDYLILPKDDIDYLILPDYEEELKYYQKEIELNPNDARAYKSMGNVYYHLDKYDK